MKTVKIYYHQFDDANYELSPLDIDGVGYEPESLFSFSKKTAIYYNCPAWSHKSKRTFLIRSPVDIDLSIVKDKNGIPGLSSSNMTQQQFNSWVGNSTFGEKNWYSEDLVTLQLGIPRFLFWTYEKNVWIEVRPFPLTSLKNNLVSMEGWWNLSEWERSTSFAFDIVDVNKKVQIKRGDPVQEICFHTKRKNDVIKLIKKQPSLNLIKKTNKILNIKNYVKGLSTNFIFNEKDKKCPFSFLWENTPQDKG